MAYKLIDIAAEYDRPLVTTWRHIQELTRQKKFEKKSPGKQYSKDEVKQLQQLMGFSLVK
jgi:hypothetical protein